MRARLLLRFSIQLGVVATGLCISAVEASASENYPLYVRDLYGMESEPPCSLCHAGATGKRGTATKPFAETLKARGAEGADIGSLDGALRSVYEERVDSDGDEVADAMELREGTDPNDGSDATPARGGFAGARGDDFELGELPKLPALPAHGCSLRNTSKKSGLLSLACVAAAAAVAVLRQRRSERAT